MKRYAGIVVIGLVAGCRTIVGIDDLQQAPPQQPDGGNGQRGSSTSSSGGNNGHDDASDAGCVDAPGGCPPCCKMAFGGALPNTFEKGAGAACLCASQADGGAECGSACAGPTDICSLVKVAGQPTPPCAQCTDRFLAKPGNACEGECDALGTPADKKNCHDALFCLSGCKFPSP